jgi:hypothetical protein
VPKSAKYLLVGSTEPCTGKSGFVLGLAQNLQEQGISIAYGKPLGNCLLEEPIYSGDADVRFISKTLNLAAANLRPTLALLDDNFLTKRLKGEDKTDYRQSLAQYLQSSHEDLTILEGPSTLDEGRIFDLSLHQMAEVLDAVVLLVVRPHSSLFVDSLLLAKERLGQRLGGVVINDTSSTNYEMVSSIYQPFLEAQGIPVMGILPRSALLRSVTVDELVKQLQAEVICRDDRLDLMVESLTIGAMSVNAAIKYFRKGTNMAVITGGDRTDIQLAALETSTQCLILTGQLPPEPLVISRAEELEVPILSVASDTLTTVEVIDRTFGKVRLHEPIKVECITQLMAEHFNFESLLQCLKLES